MGASSSSAQDSGLEGVPTLGELTDDLHFVLDESTGDLRVRFASSSSGAAATASGGGARASGGGGREVGGEGQGEGVVGREEEGGDGAVGEGEREEEEVDVDSEESDDDDDETTQSQLSTLRLLARLFGGSRTSVPYVTGLHSCDIVSLVQHTQGERAGNEARIFSMCYIVTLNSLISSQAEQ